MRRIDDIGQLELGHLPQVAVPDNRKILRIIVVSQPRRISPPPFLVRLEGLRPKALSLGLGL
jgi:hypothetical protein